MDSKVNDNNVDVVNEPSHYKRGKFEAIDEMLICFGPRKTYDFCVLNAWKYRNRAPFKGKMEEDMAKSSRYLEMAKQIADTYDMDVRLIKESGVTKGECDGTYR